MGEAHKNCTIQVWNCEKWSSLSATVRYECLARVREQHMSSVGSRKWSNCQALWHDPKRTCWQWSWLCRCAEHASTFDVLRGSCRIHCRIRGENYRESHCVNRVQTRSPCSRWTKCGVFRSFSSAMQGSRWSGKVIKVRNRECAFGLSGRGRGGSRLPGTHSTQFIGHEVMRLSTH